MATTKLGGRQAGTKNVPPLDKIRANQSKLEKILLDRALAGDIQAIDVCLKRIAEVEATERASRGGKGGKLPATQVS